MQPDEKDTQTREPEETGIEVGQQPGPEQADVSIVKSIGKLEGHPLPDTLRGLAPSFRSHPVYMLVVQWVEQTTRELDDYKEEIARVRNELEKTRQELAQQREQNVLITEKLEGQKRIGSLREFMQIIGGLLVGLSPSFYDPHQSMLAPSISVIFGLALILYARFSNGVSGR